MTARADVHDSFRHRLVDAAYRRLAADGAAGLGMRKLAADLDVTPGALYRYVAGRDELLTILVVDAYRSLNDAIRQAVTAQETADLEARWVAAWCAARDWALEHCHEYELIYGTPVPGYRAPTDTIGPASGITFLLASIASELIEASEVVADPPYEQEPEGLEADVQQIRNWLAANQLPATASTEMILLTVEAWTTLIGALSLELFGHYVGSIQHGGEYIERLARRSFAALRAAARQ